MAKRDDKAEQRRQARAQLRAAKRELADVAARTREETPELVTATARVVEAERHVSWWRR